MAKNKGYNDFESFLNECNIYVWEWDIPGQFVRFGIPSLDGLWVDEKEKIVKLATVLERVHPDDIDKIFVRRTSPIYKSDNMFEIDLRLNIGGEGKFEWYGFRGKTLKRRLGRPIYVRGVAINIDQRVRAQRKLLERKDRHLLDLKQKSQYCIGAVEEVTNFIMNLASNSDSIISGESVPNETRLMRLNELKEQAAHVADLSFKVKALLSDNYSVEANSIKHISLWEHFAELQQIFSLKFSGSLKLYFSNLYDDSSVDINVKLLDLLIENVINTQVHNSHNGYLSLNYNLTSPESLSIAITCTENASQRFEFDKSTTETGLGLSVCREIAKRMMGSINVLQDDSGKVQYQISLPVNSKRNLTKLNVLDEVEEELDAQKQQLGVGTEITARPHVLIGIQTETDLFQNQHLFAVQTEHSTDKMLQEFNSTNPDIIFIDSNLKGTIDVFRLIEEIRKVSSDTPIIVTDDYAVRPLHKKIRALGAQYLLNNPLSLRKVNVMIKKYLK